MAQKPEPPKPINWNVSIASKAVWLGEVEAPDEAAAIQGAGQQTDGLEAMTAARRNHPR